MICKNFREGELLKVADLNEIIVLIDRSKTAFVEVGLNSWPENQRGPIHSHEQKEQIFYLTAGRGKIRVGRSTYDVVVGDLLYVPAGVPHQTITDKEPVEYLLYNAFLDSEKEGDASFSDHINRVKDTRKQQSMLKKFPKTSDTQKKGKWISRRHVLSKSNTDLVSKKILFERKETHRSEVTAFFILAEKEDKVENDQQNESTFFVLSGCGKISVEGQEKRIKTFDVIYIPANTTYSVGARRQNLQYLYFDTRIEDYQFK